MKYMAIYTKNCIDHEAIYLPWSVIEKILHRGHDGNPLDDELIVRHLAANRYPAWIKDAEGFVDENGWGLIGPEKKMTNDGPND